MTLVNEHYVDGSTVTTRAAVRYVVSAEGMEPYWSADTPLIAFAEREKRRESEGVSCANGARFRTLLLEKEMIPSKKLYVYFGHKSVNNVTIMLAHHLILC